MEHPEKALFDEVRGLRTDLEDSKNRIIVVEKEYEDKVVNLERRCLIADRCEEKLSVWKSLLNSKVTLSLNEKEYTFFRTTFTDNIYLVNTNLLPENEDYVVLEMDKKFFKAMIEIVRQGNAIKTAEYQTKRRNFGTILDKKLKEEPNFVLFLQTYFVEESFLDLTKDFGLNYTYIGKGKIEDLLESYTVETPYTYSTILNHVETNVKNLGNKNNPRGLFINYNGKIDITLNETIRTNRVIIKPFSSDTYNWSPTNGATYTTIYGSLDGKSWDMFAAIPGTYGTNTNNYEMEVSFTSMASFKYIRFQGSASAYFSLSHLSFRK